jgi:hypothetical protein
VSAELLSLSQQRLERQTSASEQPKSHAPQWKVLLSRLWQLLEQHVVSPKQLWPQEPQLLLS